MKTKRSTSRSKTEQMVASLRNEIMTGKYVVGDYLPSELELCKLYELSKITVRKGLEVLVREGFIEKVPRIGAKVVRLRQAAGTTLRFGYYPTLVRETQLFRLIDAFHAKYADIRIEPIPVEYPRSHNYTERYLQDLMLDVLTVNVYDYEFIRNLGVLEPLPRYDGIYSFLYKPFAEDGQAYVQPFVFTPVILCYNKDHFKERQVPEPDACWTWNDVREASKKLAVPNERYGLFFNTLSDNRWPLFLMQNGVSFRPAADGSYALKSDDRLKESLRTCMDLMSDESLFPSYFSQSDADVENLFLKQKVSMIIATYSNLNGLCTSDLNYDIAPLPFMHEAKTLLVVIGLSVNQHSPSKEAARLFVDYMLSEEAQLYMRQHSLSIPSLKAAAEWTGDEPIRRPSRFHLFRETMNTFSYYSDLNLSYNKLAAIREELKLYWSKLDSLDEVLDRVEKKLPGIV